MTSLRRFITKKLLVRVKFKHFISGVSYVLVNKQLQDGLNNTFTGTTANPTIFIKMYSILYFVCCRASAFITCTMCIAQTIQIKAVFYQPKYWAIVGSIVTCYLTWTVVALVCFVVDMVTCDDAYLMCVPNLLPEVLTKLLFYGLPYAIPTIPVLLGGKFSEQLIYFIEVKLIDHVLKCPTECILVISKLPPFLAGVLTCFTLARYRSFRRRDKSTITVVIITMIFLVFNLGFLIHYYFHEVSGYLTQQYTTIANSMAIHDS